ncbi:MAG TPA: tripartite tricarboxylate transporter permease [Symbiobacteriaceae bacterium]|nr:tripartite tricarboxylate transporter permease [Symbiobacteriaceae bacterium]
MEGLHFLAGGFATALSATNLFYCFIGALLGTMIGVLPGIGPISGVAMLIPFTFGMNPTTAIIMMAGVYYGAMYGGSTTSILINTPGENSSVVTTLDGYQMAKQGKAGAALAVAAIGSFIAGTISVIMLMIMAPALSKIAINFGPPEYTALMILGLVAVSSLGEGNMIKALISMVLGLMLSTVGIDLQTGTARFTFGLPDLLSGVEFLIVAVALFALGEVFESSTSPEEEGERLAVKDRLWLSKEQFKESFAPIMRGSFLGFFLGCLPGAGATVSSFMSYMIEKRMSKHPEQFGKGAIAGVAGPESANNAAAGGAMVPLLTLGIPGTGTTAVLLGALMMFGVKPGPMMIQENPDLFWGLIASMYVGNAMLLILNLPLVGIFAKMLDLPKNILMPVVLVLAFLGVWAAQTNTFDVVLLAGIGVVGYFMRRLNFPAAPLLLSLVLGDRLEQSMRQSLTMSDGQVSIFFSRPISLTLLIVAFLAVAYPALRNYLAKRKAQQAEAA